MKTVNARSRYGKKRERKTFLKTHQSEIPNAVPVVPILKSLSPVAVFGVLLAVNDIVNNNGLVIQHVARRLVNQAIVNVLNPSTDLTPTL
ncbi:MAG: hypothetical protein KGO82_05660 [Bacteroidota bacterium]|nr:hypothetical protein [Bacteroidota bacterium]